MPQDAFTLKFVCAEIASRLVGGKISRINQPEKDELTLIIYTKTGTVKLEISAQAQNNRISLSDDEKPNPANAPNFCMLLRKHLQNAEITGVRQIGFERIVVFDFLCSSDFSDSEMQLYCEIMGKYSNVVLVHEGTILGAMKTTALEDNAKRILFAGAKYALPAPQDKADPRDLDALRAVMREACGNTAKYISGNVEGIAYSTAAEMTAAYGENVTAEQIYEYVHGEAAPCVTYAGGVPADFKVRSCAASQKRCDTLLEAQTLYYSYVYTKKTFEAKKRKLEGALSSRIKKCEKRLAQMEEKLFECEEADTVKLKGELITANIYRIERGMSSFEAVNYYDEEGGTVTIALDKQLTPAQNAQKYYKKYAKLKRTVENLSVQKAQAEEQLGYLESIRSSISAAELLVDLAETEEELISLGFIKQDGQKKKQKALSPYRTYVCEGFKILAGRNNVQNERLTKSLSADDVWLHAQKYHSSHVGIITEGRPVPERVLGAAAEICAHYSDGRSGNKIPVDYAYKKYVKKPPQKATGFFVYTDYKTVLVDPDGHEELRKDD